MVLVSVIQIMHLYLYWCKHSIIGTLYLLHDNFLTVKFLVLRLQVFDLLLQPDIEQIS